MTNVDRVAAHLAAHGSITSMEAIDLYGNTRLSASIFRLKRKGYPITMEMCDGVNRYGQKVRYGRYYLEV